MPTNQIDFVDNNELSNKVESLEVKEGEEGEV
jgi:hypothetical protein